MIPRSTIHTWRMPSGGRNCAARAPRERRNAPAFDGKQRAAKYARPTDLPLRVEMLIEMRGANVTVTLEMLGAPDDALGAMKQAERRDPFGKGLFRVRAVSDPK